MALSTLRELNYSLNTHLKTFVLFLGLLPCGVWANSIKYDTTAYLKAMMPEISSFYKAKNYKAVIKKAQTYFNQADVNSYTHALVNSMLAENYYLLGNPDSAIYFLNESYKIYLSELHDTLKAAVIQNNIGVTYYVGDKIGNALEVFLHNAHISRLLADTQLMVLSA